jgi:hypothetical protein
LPGGGEDLNAIEQAADAFRGAESRRTMTTIPSGTPSSTERSRRHRQRRRRGTRCITVDVNELEVSVLVVKGYLPEEARNNVKAIKAAIEGAISAIAFDLQQGTSTRSGSPR